MFYSAIVEAGLIPRHQWFNLLWPNLSGQAIWGVLQQCRRVFLPSPWNLCRKRNEINGNSKTIISRKRIHNKRNTVTKKLRIFCYQNLFLKSIITIEKNLSYFFVFVSLSWTKKSTAFIRGRSACPHLAMTVPISQCFCIYFEVQNVLWKTRSLLKKSFLL